MTTIAERMPSLEQVTAQARQIRFWASALKAIGFALFALGWVAYKVLSLLWLGVAWAIVMSAAGWKAAAKEAEVKRGAGTSGQ